MKDILATTVLVISASLQGCNSSSNATSSKNLELAPKDVAYRILHKVQGPIDRSKTIKVIDSEYSYYHIIEAYDPSFIRNPLGTLQKTSMSNTPFS